MSELCNMYNDTVYEHEYLKMISCDAVLQGVDWTDYCTWNSKDKSNIIAKLLRIAKNIYVTEV